jgi:regulator of sirC expression with transglutaminase-like and TPR domain
MNIGTSFVNDPEFQKLLGRRTDVDLLSAALELARDATPDLDEGPVRAWVEQRANELITPLARARTEEEAIREIGLCLSERHGVRGRDDSYEHPESSFLNSVIERRSGIPISLSVLYMAVAERAGWPLSGVSAPRHFLTRYEGQGGPLFVDAFDGGSVLTLEECLVRAEALSGMPREAILPMLEPATSRAIVIRMLNNLKSLYARLEQWPAAWKVQARLVALQPAVYAERRDFGLISVKAQKFGLAVDHLKACLRDCPSDEAELIQGQIVEAQSRVGTWN